MNFLKWFLFFVLVIGFSLKSNCQTVLSKVEIIESNAVKELMQKQTNLKLPIKGYRVKIHFGTDKATAKEIKSKFIARFQNVPAYEKYDQPNFNIRVGDFRTKLEAYKFLKEVQPEFPTAFIVQDEIEFPSID